MFGTILTGAELKRRFPHIDPLIFPFVKDDNLYELTQSLLGPVARLIDSRSITDWGMPEGKTGFGKQERIVQAEKSQREYLPGTEPRTYSADAVPGKALR